MLGKGISSVPSLSLRPGTDPMDPATLFSGQEKLEHTTDGSASIKGDYSYSYLPGYRTVHIIF